ncbi:PSD1 and planctomycete cytochrome C domain-containing protein [Aeoliella mucimassa]|uniref:Planctomycete cytochrome C n=1 Tax=Aeoliella mucimassa TaxID=2527972 RepID=A0A518AH56_9BACT|nr:PSD1 and planctomycete cytochrome C domain-containing protein [Aeoliella mucimassa]QDU54042.1 Planctomycete cytochrome C [Aeoliella mucimassa]
MLFAFRWQRAIWLPVLLLATAGDLSAAEPVSYARQVQPLLAARCFACHGPDDAESSLALHEQDASRAETDSGMAAIVPGEPDESELVRRIASTDEFERMPPEGEPLTPDEIALLRQWVAEGAEYEKHWAFLPPEAQPVPEVKQTSWVANPIDAFVLAKLEAAGLEPSPPASKRTLVRRVYYDITGLPPTQDEIDAFMADDRPDAYEHLVDQLLASPKYGEKWARHWLDVVRYAESNSFERDATKPYVWKYRDYVIRSLNEDKPYDQFVREQIAGDELDQVTTETMTATGYYRLGTWDDEPADPLQSRYDDMDNIVSTTAQGFLGLTVGCARCHDHKIDPIPQADYYSMLSFFADVTPYAPRRADPKIYSLHDCSGPEQAERRKQIENQIAEIKTSQYELEQLAISKLPAPEQRRSETEHRQEVLDEHLQENLDASDFATYSQLSKQATELARQLADDSNQPEYVLSLAVCHTELEPTHIMLRGNPHVPGDEVEPRFPTLFGDDLPQIPAMGEGARSSGRRRVLADWIASDDNMLTGRVITNRVWQHHFGRGIVRSASNFGQLGTPPTHPELLDWLTAYLVQHDWHLKPLHRLILTSNTYRMTSTATPEGLATDPANDLLWRFDMRRLTAEEIRDTILQVSGQLNTKLYGPSVYPKLSQEVLATQSQPGKDWYTSSEHDAARRSIYLHIKRSLIVPELSLFDFPETEFSCEARFNTTQAAQALSLLHSEFMQRQAKYLAKRVKSEAGEQLDDQVTHALTLTLGRPADEPSVTAGLALIDTFRTKHGLDHDEALRQYCLMVMNLNEFVYLD